MVSEDKLKVLMIEDSEQEAEQISLLLARGGFQTEYSRVVSAEPFKVALLSQYWDLILSDYDFPQLTAQEALRIIHETKHEIPLIILSSRVGEEAAEHIMALGAYDFMLKHNPARLIPAIRRVLNEAMNYQRFITARNALQKAKLCFKRSLPIFRAWCFSFF